MLAVSVSKNLMTKKMANCLKNLTTKNGKFSIINFQKEKLHPYFTGPQMTIILFIDLAQLDQNWLIGCTFARPIYNNCRYNSNLHFWKYPLFCSYWTFGQSSTFAPIDNNYRQFNGMRALIYNWYK